MVVSVSNSGCAGLPTGWQFLALWDCEFLFSGRVLSQALARLGMLVRRRMTAHLKLTDCSRHMTTKPADLAGHFVACASALPVSRPAVKKQAPNLLCGSYTQPSCQRQLGQTVSVKLALKRRLVSNH